MAAPKFTPVSPIGAFRDGEGLPPALSWSSNRPGDLVGAQPVGARLGSPGPNQGYAIKLAHSFHGKLTLAPGENEHDVMAGCLPVALKRASLYGRAPVVHDLRRAFNVFGFLGDAPADLVAFRSPLFQAAGHHYEVQRTIADLVPESTLRMADATFDLATRGGQWRQLLSLDAGAPIA